MAIFGPWEQPIFEGWSVLAGARSAHLADPARADGRRQHVPQPGADRQAGDDARPRLGRSGRARHRRRLVRARARRLRHRLRRERRRAARPARRGGHADAPAARRRAVQPRGPLLHVPRRAVRAAADPGTRCRSSSAAPGRARRCGPWRCGPTAGTRAGRSRRSAARLDILAEHCADVGRDIATDREDHQLPDRPARRSGRGRGGVRRADGPQRHRGDGEQCEPARQSPTEVADALRPYAELGFETVIVRMPAPYDRETIDRMARVAELLGA